MILTVTPNTAVDHVYETRHYEPGQRLSVLRQTECIGGKGNLVSAFVVDLGIPSVSLGFAAGHNGRRLAELLRARGVRVDFTPAQGETRRIVVVVDEKRQGQTWLIPETLRVNRPAERDLEKRVARWLPKSSWLALCGSLPPGCSPQLYCRLTKMAHTHKVPVLIDSRGPALRQALRARPQVLKLNLAELQQSFSSPLGPQEGAAVDPVAILKTGVQLAVCTMGEEGALAFAGEGRWVLLPPKITMRSSAGSGDVFTAALLVWREKGAEWPEALRWATAAGAAKAEEARTDYFDSRRIKSLYPQVRVEASAHSCSL